MPLALPPTKILQHACEAACNVISRIMAFSPLQGSVLSFALCMAIQNLTVALSDNNTVVF